MTDPPKLRPHLPLTLTLTGTTKSRPFPRKLPPQTETNLKTRVEHGHKLQVAAATIISNRQTLQKQRPSEAPTLPASVPLVIQADPALIQRASLKAYGLEVVTELDNGCFLTAANDPKLSGLQNKIDLFLSHERGGSKVAGIWEILDGQERLKHILSPTLLSAWHQIESNQRYTVDVGIACLGIHSELPRFATKQTEETEASYLDRLDRWMKKRDQQQAEWGHLQTTRLQELAAFLQQCGGTMQTHISFPDSFTCRIQLPGQGLKDLALNFSSLFEMVDVAPSVNCSIPQAAELVRTEVCLIERIADHAFPPVCLSKTVALHPAARLLIHLPTTASSYRHTHMSTWAATIDQVIAQRDVLVILPASRAIPDPAQSLLALTIGAIDSSESLDTVNTVAPAESAPDGSGIWNTIKPEVVVWVQPESNEEETEDSPRKSALAAIEAAYQLIRIAEIFPQASSLLYRALLVQSARWLEPVQPGKCSADLIRQLGYGLPQLERAIGNAPHRITFATWESQPIKARQAHIYQINLPSDLTATHPDLEVLVEVTLSYKARPARSHRGHRDYLSTWLNWESNKKGEASQHFLQRMLKDYEPLAPFQDGAGGFRWAIGTTTRYDPESGMLQRFSRSTSTIQKDWVQLTVAALGSSFCVAVMGHQGWDSDPTATAEYVLVVSFEAREPSFPLYDVFNTPP